MIVTCSHEKNLSRDDFLNCRLSWSFVDVVSVFAGERMWSVDHLDGCRGGVCRYM